MMLFSKLSYGDVEDTDQPTTAELADDGNNLMMKKEGGYHDVIEFEFLFLWLL